MVHVTSDVITVADGKGKACSGLPALQSASWHGPKAYADNTIQSNRLGVLSYSLMKKQSSTLAGMLSFGPCVMTLSTK